LNTVGTLLGEICKKIFPISEEVFIGNQKSSLSICTLSSMTLLKQISTSDLMNNIIIAGRLLSENKGIDSLIRNSISTYKIKTLILCGKDIFGHKAGHSLMALFKNGIDDDNRIIGSTSPDPILLITQDEVEKFRNQVKVIDKIGVTSFSEIKQIVKNIN